MKEALKDLEVRKRKADEFLLVKETLLSEIEELEARLCCLKKRVINSEKLGVGDGIILGTGKIITLIAQYQILDKEYAREIVQLYNSHNKEYE